MQGQRITRNETYTISMETGPELDEFHDPEYSILEVEQKWQGCVCNSELSRVVSMVHVSVTGCNKDLSVSTHNGLI